MAEIDTELLYADWSEPHIEIKFCFCDRCIVLSECAVINGRIAICEKCQKQICTTN